MQELLTLLQGEFFLGPHSDHGSDHWLRVHAYGQYLAQRTGADARVVELFALFHDCRRVNETYDPGHGARGAQQARRYHGVHFQLTAAQLDLLDEACTNHTDEPYSENVTIGTCWDSDRLDLDRVGVDELDLLQISTEAGRELARLPAAERRRRVGIDIIR